MTEIFCADIKNFFDLNVGKNGVTYAWIGGKAGDKYPLFEFAKVNRQWNKIKLERALNV